MIKLYKKVALTKNVPEKGLRRGDVGAVVMIHDDGGYEVEFMTFSGDTIAVVTLEPHDVRPVGADEIANARAVASASP